MIYGIFLTLLLPNFYKCHCPIYNTTKPQFSKPMLQGIIMILNQTGFVRCCIIGAKEITWWFKTNNPNDSFRNINQFNKNYIFMENHRLLMVKKPKPRIHEGYYKCIGTKPSHKSISGSSKVKVVKSQSRKDIEIIDRSDTEKIIFQQYFRYQFYCLVKIYQGFSCSFSWNIIRNGKRTSILQKSALNRLKTNSSLIEGYNGWSMLEKNPIPYDRRFNKYNFSLTLLDFKTFDDELLSCFIKETNEKDEHVFKIHIVSKRFYNSVLGIKFLLFFILMVTLFTTFYHETKMIIKGTIRKILFNEKPLQKYNFFFIYDFENDSHFKMVYKLVRKLEVRKFSTYFYHRDQTYGRNVQEDIVDKLKYCDVIVLWITKEMWKNTQLIFCLQIIMKMIPGKQRLYILTKHKNHLMEDCDNKVILMDIESWLSSKTFLLNQKIINVNNNNNKTKIIEIWYWQRLLNWLVSNLPINSSVPI